MKTFAITLLLLACSFLVQAQMLPGFKPSGQFNEQQLVIENSPANTRILINAPLKGFGKKDKVSLVFFALPNGNTIEQTFGKTLRTGDDWHYNIQHIGAQTRFLRNQLRKETLVIVYVEAKQKSWPAWVAATRDSVQKIRKIVDDVKAIFASWNPRITLNGHSGGGRFIFSYINAVDRIPDDVVRIAFLDSNYGYEDSLAGRKLIPWLKSGNNKSLCSLTYNDSVVVYNGKPLVSPKGGTWYRSRLMLRYLSNEFKFKTVDRDSLIWNTALKGRIEIILRNNPDKKIYHTTQVELNGFIHSMLSGTNKENKKYTYFGRRAYSSWIADSIIGPIRRLNFPVRPAFAETGTAFMRRIATLPLQEREAEIYAAISTGNIPDFLRNTITISDDFADSLGIKHRVTYEVMPDYLAVGSDSNFCRIPMNPSTAQKLAELVGGSLLTAKLSDYIYGMAKIRLEPFFYKPIGNSNELVTRFEEHNLQIEKQFKEAKGKLGQLVAGIKKDVILSSRNVVQPSKVVIYGWHKPDAKPIQPVYSGHVYWYVDYSHGIRLVNNQVLVDGKPCLISDILKDPILFRLFSNEQKPMQKVGYFP